MAGNNQPSNLGNNGSNPSLDAMLSSLQTDEMRRHQQSANGTAINDPYANIRLGVFPVQGARPPRVTGPLDPEYIRRFSINNNDGNNNNNNNNNSGNANPGQNQNPTPTPTSHSQPLPSNVHPAQTPNVGMADLPRQSKPWNDDHLGSFLVDMPNRGEDAARHAMFTELIRLKTRSIELQIAEAQRKAKEAELELVKWKGVAERKIAESNAAPTGASAAPQANFASFESMTGINGESIVLPPQPFPAQPAQPIPSMTGPTAPSHGTPIVNPPTPMTNFDFESLQAMAFDSNLENLFSFLDPTQRQSQNGQQQVPQTMSGMDATGTLDPNNMYFNNLDTPFFPTSDFGGTPIVPTQPMYSPTKRQTSPTSDLEAISPPMKRTKRTIEKKIVVERTATCPGCQKTIARILFRAPRDRIPEDISIDLRCTDCAPVVNPSTLPEPSTSGTSIGTVEMRKRLRATLEMEDEEKREVVRRQWCDVCQRIVASGRLIGGEKENMSPIAEIICAHCDGKYQR